MRRVHPPALPATLRYTARSRSLRAAYRKSRIRAGVRSAGTSPATGKDAMATAIRNGCPVCHGSREPGWLCADHPGKAWGHEGCGAAGVPCQCNLAGALAFQTTLPDPPTRAEAAVARASQGRVVETARRLRAEATRLCILAALKYEACVGAASIFLGGPTTAAPPPLERGPEFSTRQEQRVQERRDLALLLYYPNEEAHSRAREAVLARIREAMLAADLDTEAQLQRAFDLTNATYDAQRIRLVKLWPATRFRTGE
jgi:hypothetical protein